MTVTNGNFVYRCAERWLSVAKVRAHFESESTTIAWWANFQTFKLCFNWIYRFNLVVVTHFVVGLDVRVKQLKVLKSETWRDDGTSGVFHCVQVTIGVNWIDAAWLSEVWGRFGVKMPAAREPAWIINAPERRRSLKFVTQQPRGSLAEKLLKNSRYHPHKLYSSVLLQSKSSIEKTASLLIKLEVRLVLVT